MLNFAAKILLVSTSLSPVLGAVILSEIERGEDWTSWIWWVVVALVMVFLCWFLLKYSAIKGQEIALSIKRFESKDQETLTFLFIYLLPFIQSEHSIIANGWFTSFYVIAILVVAIVYADAYHFNPLMRYLFGYRFYGVKDHTGISNLLISKLDLRRSEMEVNTVRIAQNVHLHIGDNNA